MLVFFTDPTLPPTTCHLPRRWPQGPRPGERLASSAQQGRLKVARPPRKHEYAGVGLRGSLGLRLPRLAGRSAPARRCRWWHESRGRRVRRSQRDRWLPHFERVARVALACAPRRLSTIIGTPPGRKPLSSAAFVLN